MVDISFRPIPSVPPVRPVKAGEEKPKRRRQEKEQEEPPEQEEKKGGINIKA